MTRGSEPKKAPRPTTAEIGRLLAFLLRLTAEGFAPILKWGGGEKNANGAYVMPWPVYDEVVKAFFDEASKECWNDADYVPELAGRMLDDEPRVRRANLDEVRTYCVRGERFCDGRSGAMIEAGHVRRLLERLADCGRSLANKTGRTAGAIGRWPLARQMQARRGNVCSFRRGPRCGAP